MSNVRKSQQDYQDKTKIQFDNLNEQIEVLKAKGEEVKADAETEFEAIMTELYSKRDEAEIKLRLLQNSSEEAWEEMQSGFEIAWNELNNAWNNALAKF